MIIPKDIQVISISHTVMVKPGKSREFDQVLGSILVKSRMLEQCLCFNFKRLSKKKDQYSIYAEWKNTEFLNLFFFDNLFNLIISAIAVLCYSHEIEVTSGQTRIINVSSNMHDKNYTKQLQDKLIAALTELDESN